MHSAFDSQNVPYLELCKFKCWIFLFKINKCDCQTVWSWKLKLCSSVADSSLESPSSYKQSTGVEWGKCWGMFVCGSETSLSLSFCFWLMLTILILTFGPRFCTVRSPPLKSRQRRLLAVLCLFAARTFRLYSLSYHRRETAMTSTSLWCALHGQVRKGTRHLVCDFWRKGTSRGEECFRACLLSLPEWSLGTLILSFEVSHELFATLASFDSLCILLYCGYNVFFFFFILKSL